MYVLISVFICVLILLGIGGGVFTCVDKSTFLFLIFDFSASVLEVCFSDGSI